MSFWSGLYIEQIQREINPHSYTHSMQNIQLQLPVSILFNVMVIVFIWTKSNDIEFHSIHSIISHRKMLTNINWHHFFSEWSLKKIVFDEINSKMKFYRDTNLDCHMIKSCDQICDKILRRFYHVPTKFWYPGELFIIAVYYLCLPLWKVEHSELLTMACF